MLKEHQQPSDSTLTCGLAPVYAHVLAGDTSLITQRSQVQILPPLQSEIAGQRRFSERSGNRLWHFPTAACPHL
jgi:hypothetical protein